MTARETAYAKLNLALHVRRRRADGYHDIETLFAFCADGDVLAWREAPGLAIVGPLAASLSSGEDNLVLRAQRAFAEHFGHGGDGGFRLDKRLPVAAGIGGGSADAAAALRLLCRRAGIDPVGPDVLRIGAALGADVPACIVSTTLRGEGRGERMMPVPGLSGRPVLLVNPGVATPTGPVFAAWDGNDRGPLGDGDPLAAARAGRNDLEPPATTLVPVIGAVAALLGAQPRVVLSRMSGSGATCFALFADTAARDAADAAVAQAQPGWWRLATSLL